MKPYKVNIINAGVLILFGLFAFFSSTKSPVTALIPVAFGMVLLAMTYPFKRENKAVAHVVVLLTLLIVVALFMPLSKAWGREDYAAVFRVAAMMISSLYALSVFIRHFILNRKNKKLQS